MDFSSSRDRVEVGMRPSPPKSGERMLRERTSLRTSASRGWLRERILERARIVEKRFTLWRRGAVGVSYSFSERKEL